MGRDVDMIYRHYRPTTDQKNRFNAIRDKSKELDRLISNVCPGGRERDIAHRKLEEACMWALASIDRNK